MREEKRGEKKKIKSEREFKGSEPPPFFVVFCHLAAIPSCLVSKSSRSRAAIYK